MKLGKIGLVSDGLVWVKTWCGMILVWDMSGVGYISLGYVVVWVDFGVGYVGCGICRCGICLVWDMSVWDKSGYQGVR